MLLLVLLLFVLLPAEAAAAPGPAPPLLARVTWDAAAADVDLHVFDAGGGHGWYRATGGVSGTSLSADVLRGPGEEVVTGVARAGARLAFGLCWYASRDPARDARAPRSVGGHRRAARAARRLVPGRGR